jgi:N-acylglucosamine-6-phosphate 2-epimerase
MKTFQELIPRGLVVSCQAPEGEPLHGSRHMARMAVAAEVGGAVGIRANGPDDIRAIREAVKLPIIGIFKMEYDNSPVYITPTFKEAEAVAEAGADVIAIDATLRSRPGGVDLAELIGKIRRDLDLPVMADVAVYEEGINAAHLGADAVASTLSGYVEYSPKHFGPDLDLVRRLAADLPEKPVVAEGRYNTPEQAEQGIQSGAWAVVVGTAITRPQVITRGFADAVQGAME